MAIKNKICSDSWKRIATKEDFAEITLFVENHLKINLDVIYEDDQYIYFGKNCDESVFYKVYKSSCCNFYIQVEEGNFIDEIPEINNVNVVTENKKPLAPYDETVIFKGLIPIGVKIDKIEITTGYQMYFAGAELQITGMKSQKFETTTYFAPDKDDPSLEPTALKLLTFEPQDSNAIYNGEDIIFNVVGGVTVPNHQLDFTFKLFYI